MICASASKSIVCISLTALTRLQPRLTLSECIPDLQTHAYTVYHRCGGTFNLCRMLTSDSKGFVNHRRPDSLCASEKWRSWPPSFIPHSGKMYFSDFSFSREELESWKINLKSSMLEFPGADFNMTHHLKWTLNRLQRARSGFTLFALWALNTNPCLSQHTTERAQTGNPSIGYLSKFWLTSLMNASCTAGGYKHDL